MQHIDQFRIKNFKKLEDVSLDEIGKVNLIVGDNNSGKTSLLESLLFSKNEFRLLRNFHKILCFRDLHIHSSKSFDLKTGALSEVKLPIENYLDFIINTQANFLEIEYTIKGQSKKKHIRLESVPYKELSEKNKKTIITPTIYGLTAEYSIKFYLDNRLVTTEPLYAEGARELHNWSIPFITFNAGYKKELIETYYSTIHKSKKLRKAFAENLKFIIPGIEEVMVSKIADREVLSVSIENFDEPLPLTRFGDGSVRMLRILLEITKAENGRLMVDELSNGIHYSKLKIFWKTVIRAAIKSNVQLFATTHSLECLQNYVEAVKELNTEIDSNQMNCYKLTTIGKENKIKAYRYNYDQFRTLLESEVELRGTPKVIYQ